MCRIVCPIASAISEVPTAASGQGGGTAPTIDIATPVEIIEVIDVNVVVAPPAAPAPTPAPERSHHHAKPERNRCAGGVITPRRIVNRRIWIVRRTVHDHRIVGRYIHYLRIGLLNYDDALVF